MTLQIYAAHDVLVLLADKQSGIWVGSAKAFAANCGAGDISERQARHILESLEKGRYIRRFPIRRSHKNYPILIDKFQPTFGAYTGMRLNAVATTDWGNPVYESCQEDGAERTPIREGDLRPETETPPRAEKTTPSDQAIALASLLSQRILENNPSHKFTHGHCERWAREFDLMIQRDQRTPALIREVIEFSQRDSFWRVNVHSMASVRKYFGRFALALQGGKENGRNGRGKLSRTDQDNETCASQDSDSREFVVRKWLVKFCSMFDKTISELLQRGHPRQPSDSRLKD